MDIARRRAIASLLHAYTIQRLRQPKYGAQIPVSLLARVFRARLGPRLPIALELTANKVHR